eukprot:scaffold249020_cov28-Tisochrysis_lutea.AAC.6
MEEPTKPTSSDLNSSIPSSFVRSPRRASVRARSSASRRLSKWAEWLESELARTSSIVRRRSCSVAIKSTQVSVGALRRPEHAPATVHGVAVELRGFRAKRGFRLWAGGSRSEAKLTSSGKIGLTLSRLGDGASGRKLLGPPTKERSRRKPLRSARRRLCASERCIRTASTWRRAASVTAARRKCASIRLDDDARNVVIASRCAACRPATETSARMARRPAKERRMSVVRLWWI